MEPAEPQHNPTQRTNVQASPQQQQTTMHRKNSKSGSWLRAAASLEEPQSLATSSSESDIHVTPTTSSPKSVPKSTYIAKTPEIKHLREDLGKVLEELEVTKKRCFILVILLILVGVLVHMSD